MDSELTKLLSTFIVIGIPIVTLIWKVGDYFITKERHKAQDALKRQEQESQERIRKIEKDAEIEIKKAEIQANLKAQQDIFKAVENCNLSVEDLKGQFNKMIDFMVSDPETRDRIRRTHNR